MHEFGVVCFYGDISTLGLETCLLMFAHGRESIWSKLAQLPAATYTAASSRFMVAMKSTELQALTRRIYLAEKRLKRSLARQKRTCETHSRETLLVLIWGGHDMEAAVQFLRKQKNHTHSVGRGRSRDRNPSHVRRVPCNCLGSLSHGTSCPGRCKSSGLFGAVPLVVVDAPSEPQRCCPRTVAFDAASNQRDSCRHSRRSCANAFAPLSRCPSAAETLVSQVPLALESAAWPIATSSRHTRS